MLVNINDSHMLGDSTIVNVPNLSRRKVFCAPFSLSQRGSVFRTKKVNYLNREDCFRHSGFFGKFNSFSHFFDHFHRDFKLITKSKISNELTNRVFLDRWHLSYLRATFLLFSFLFIFLAVSSTNFVPMELFSKLRAVVKRYRYFL